MKMSKLAALVAGAITTPELTRRKKFCSVQGLCAEFISRDEKQDENIYWKYLVKLIAKEREKIVKTRILCCKLMQFLKN
jgi:hypothetical protein